MRDAQGWSRRRVLRLATIGSGTLLALTACAQAGRGSATLSSVTTTTSSARQNASASNRTQPAVHSMARSATPLTFMQTFKPSERARLDSLFLPDVKRDLPQIALAIIPQKPHYTDLQILIAANSQPDVAMNNGFNPLGMFEDPSAYINRDHVDLSPYSTSMLHFMHWNGILWSLPVSIGGNGPVWSFNKTRFDKSGVPYPPNRWDDPTWTWQELIRRTRALTSSEGGTTTYGFGPNWAWWTQPRPWGSQWVTLDAKTVTADTPQMLQAFTVWQDMYTKYGVLPQPGEQPGYGTTQDPLLTGASAIRPIGSWLYSNYIADKTIAWAFAPIPKGTVTATDQDYYGVSIVKGAKHPDAAWQFARWLATTVDYSLVRQVFPALPRFGDQWLAAVFGDQVAPRRAHLIKEGVAFAAHSDGLVVHAKAPQMEKAVGALVAKLTAGQLTPADMLRQAQTQLEALARAP